MIFFIGFAIFGVAHHYLFAVCAFGVLLC